MSNGAPEFNPAMQADEPLTPFDVTRTSEGAGLLKLLIGFGALLLIAFIVFKLYQPGTRDRDDPPLITADNTPFKIIPDDREGMQTPDQDKEVFEVMTGGDTRDDVITLPPPEDPVDRPVVTFEPREEAPIIEDPVVEAPVVEEPDPVEETPAFEPQPVRTEPAPTPPATGSSDWVVQVASLRSQAEAENTYSGIASRNSSLLSAFTRDIVRVDLAEKGVYYRARVAGFGSKADADRTCSQLKAAGQSCFVTRR